MAKCYICKVTIKKAELMPKIGLRRYCKKSECFDKLIDQQAVLHANRAKKAREKIEREAAMAVNRKKKEKAKAWAKEKRDFKANDIKVRKPAAKAACHLYIRERDKGSFCICCGEPLDEDYHAGHFYESGNNSGLRYDEDNIHAQNLQCNYFKGGDSGSYEKHLRMKIGDERVDALKLKSGGGPITRTAEDYREIEDYYKAKLVKLIDDRGY